MSVCANGRVAARLAVILVATICVVLGVCAPALASTIHVFSSSFGSCTSGPPCSAAGEVSSPQGVAVNQATGDVYVADSGNARVDEFDSSGAFIRAWGWGVADGASSFETCTTTCRAGIPPASGQAAAAGQFSTPTFIAVDNSAGASAGDVYVGDTGDNLVTKFTSAGALVSSWGTAGQLNGSAASGGPFTSIAGITIDTSGDLFVYDPSSQNWFEFAQDGTPGTTISFSRQTLPVGIGVDSAGNFYKVVGSGNVEQYSSSGTDVGPVDSGASDTGFAIDSSSTDIYVDDGGAIEHFAPSCVPASGPCTVADSFGSGELSSAAGLAVDSSSGVVYAADSGDQRIDVFTPATLPDVVTGVASNVGLASATLNGTVNPNGTTITDCHFDYVDDADYNASAPNPYSAGHTTPCTSTPAGSSAVAVSADISALTPSTSYHFRLEASNSSGPSFGSDETFSTTGPPTVDGESASAVDPSTESLNAQIDPHGFDTTYHFEYGTAGPCASNPCTSVPVPDADIGSQTTDQPVTQPAGGLTAGSYHYRVVATSSHGTVAGPDQTFTIGALVDGESVSAVATTYATVNAQINPDGADTTYHFEYGSAGPCSSNQCTSVPVPDADIGAGSGDQAVSQRMIGLLEGTTYYYRVVATNATGSTDGPDRTFTTFSTPTPPAGSCPNAQLRIDFGGRLPDCRAYEQVTPVDKGGVSALEYEFATEASNSGDAITFFSGGGMPGGVGEQETPSYLSSRGPLGWSTAGLLPPASYGEQGGDHVQGWNGDLSEVFVEASSATGTTFLLRNSSDGSLRTIVPYSSVPYYNVDGTNADTSLVFFEAQGAQLTLNAASGQTNLYVWDRSTGQVSLVGVLPDGSTPAGGSFGGPYDWVDASTSTGGASARNPGFLLQYEHAISSDGSKVFFTAGGTGQLYLRENPASASATTVHVSASQKTNGTGPGGSDPNGPQPAAFMFAPPDGSKGLFTSPEELTNNATTGTADQGNDLYQYDTTTGALTDLAADSSDPNGAQVQGVLGMSADGSYVYFVANGALAPGASPGTCNGGGLNGIARKGACNLYEWHDGTISFITQLQGGALPGDANDWMPEPGAAFSGNANAQTSRVTSDGQTLLFAASESLTGYDSQGQSELYRYSAASAKLECVSCDPTGAAPRGPAILETTPSSQVGLPFAPSAFVTRNLSASGEQVFFDSRDPLLPQAVNGVENVYEWEANGAGSCHSTAQNGGCLYLLSTGTSPDGSYFGDASATGNDVFIFTDQQLVGQDHDQLGDIYDVHVNGGLGSQWPASSTPCATSEQCRAATPSTAPPPAATATFSGPGNATPRSVGRVTVTRKALKGNRFTLSVKVPSSGRITASGTDVRHATKSVARAGTYRLSLRLTAKARKALERKRKLKVTVHVTFRPTVGASSTANVSITVHA